MHLTVPIVAVRRETPRSIVVTLRMPADRFAFRPGQGLLIGAHGGGVQRPYSIASAPHEVAARGELALLMQVDQEGSPGTHLPTPVAGQLTDIRGPIGGFDFPDHPAERHVLFIAGGTGISPLRAMLWHAVRIAPPLHMALLYSARREDEFAFGRELQGLAAEGRIVLQQTVTRDAAAEWSGERGRITSAQLAGVLRTPATLVFVCGPPTLVHDIPRLLGQLGVDRGRIRVEEWER